MDKRARLDAVTCIAELSGRAWHIDATYRHTFSIFGKEAPIGLWKYESEARGDLMMSEYAFRSSFSAGQLTCVLPPCPPRLLVSEEDM